MPDSLWGGWGGNRVAFFTLIGGGASNTGTLLTDILFAICSVMLLGCFEARPATIAARLAEMVALFVLGCSLDALCSCFDLSLYPSPTPLALFLALGAYALVQRRLALVDRVARSVTFMALFALVVVVTRTIMPALTGLSNLSFGYSLPSIFSYVCMIASALFIRLLSVERFSTVPWQGLVLLVSIDVLGGLAGWSFMSLHDTYDFLDVTPESGSFLVGLSRSISWVNLVVCMSFILLVILAYLMFSMLAKEHAERTELLVTKKSEVDLVSQMRVTQSMYENLRTMRHELKNHDAYLASLLDAGDYEGLRAAFDSYVEKSTPALSGVSSGNMVVDCVVNAKMAVARAQGIEIRTALAVPPELPFERVDLFRLLANLLDNAIEGTSAADAAPGPVSLKIVPRMGYYFISTSNPCDPGQVRRGSEGTLLTTKADEDVHGYGTKVIRQIAKKYHGEAYFSVDGETFVVCVMLAKSEDDGGGS